MSCVLTCPNRKTRGTNNITDVSDPAFTAMQQPVMSLVGFSSDRSIWMLWKWSVWLTTWKTNACVFQESNNDVFRNIYEYFFFSFTSRFYLLVVCGFNVNNWQLFKLLSTPAQWTFLTRQWREMALKGLKPRLTLLYCSEQNIWVKWNNPGYTWHM